MKKNSLSFWTSILIIIIFIAPSSIALNYNIKQNLKKIDGFENNNFDLDIQFIYNITSALSNIIFEEYDEEKGEIAKGRAFGSKGEHKAAEILYENMTLIGIDTRLERLESSNPDAPKSIITKLDVIDYEAKINDETIECYIAPSWKGPKENPTLLDYTFSYKDLKIKEIPKYPLIFNLDYRKETDDFVFIGKDQWNDPNGVMPVIDNLKPYLNPLKFYMLFHVTSLSKIQLETDLWYYFYPNCKGLILHDFNKDCYDMIYFIENGNSLPVIFINGTIGDNIVSNPEDYTLDFDLKQQYNDSVISYNVIGEIKGTDNQKTVILSCLYDSWWNQGTADSAIGMGIVLAIAKYFKENNITPKYNLKFIGFSGEEYDMRGAKYYEAINKDENIIAILDLNQVGFTQNDPRLTLDFCANKLSFLGDVMEIVEKSNYVQRTGNVTDVKGMWWPSGYIPGNSLVFAMNRRRINAMTIFKDGGWVLHHRDGKNHTEGDVLKYFNWTDTTVTAEIVLNITKYLVSEEFKSYDFKNQINFINTDFQINEIKKILKN